ncbi:MAG: SAM-dependent methyltransferase, partial [Chloroflexota bacterium]
MNLVEHNRQAWNKITKAGSLWATPVDDETIDNAKKGDWAVSLMGLKPVPKDWFGDIKGKRILCLGS